MMIFPSAYNFDEHVPVWKSWWFRLGAVVVCIGLVAMLWILLA